MSSSAYPVIWALKHAPVVDAEERAIVLALADHGDADGRNCFPSIATLARVALVSPSTVKRKLGALRMRGVIRFQPGPPPARWLAMKPFERARIYELMIPFAWWSDAQRVEIDRMRADRGAPPLTPADRPDLPPAPPRRARADKGRPAPQRRPKGAGPTTGKSAPEAPQVSKTPGVDNPRGGVFKTPPPGSSRPLPPGLEDPQPSCSYLPVEPSSSSSERLEPERDGGCVQEEEGRLAARDRQDEPEAYAVVDAAAARWVGHRAPTAAERRRLAQRVAAALAEGAQRHHVVHALTRDLAAGQVRTTAVQVVMGRTAIPGWADPPAHVPEPRPAPHPTWCGTCERTTRMQQLDDGRVGRCRTCHPHYATGAA